MNKRDLLDDASWGLNEARVFLGYLTEATREATDAAKGLADALERIEAARRVHEWKGDWLI